MENGYVIATDSTTDMGPKYYEENKVAYIGMHYTMDGTEYIQYSESDLAVKDFPVGSAGDQSGSGKEFAGVVPAAPRPPEPVALRRTGAVGGGVNRAVVILQQTLMDFGMSSLTVIRRMADGGCHFHQIIHSFALRIVSGHIR